jgi:hypothetical protein
LGAGNSDYGQCANGGDGLLEPGCMVTSCGDGVVQDSPKNSFLLREDCESNANCVAPSVCTGCKCTGGITGSATIAVNLDPLKLVKGNSFTTANVVVNADSEADCGDIYVVVSMKDRVSGAAVGNSYTSPSQNLPPGGSTIFDFIGQLNEQSLDVGQYKVIVEPFSDSACGLPASQAVNFSVILPSGVSSPVPELGWLLLPLIAAVVLSVTWNFSKK